MNDKPPSPWPHIISDAIGAVTFLVLVGMVLLFIHGCR